MYTEQKYKRSMLSVGTIFHELKKKDPRNVQYSQKAYFSHLFTSLVVSISLLPRLSIHLTGVAFQEVC